MDVKAIEAMLFVILVGVIGAAIISLQSIKAPSPVVPLNAYCIRSTQLPSPITCKFKGTNYVLEVDNVNFIEVVLACFDNKEYVSNWKRLRKITSWDEKSFHLFIRDVENTVWDRLPRGEAK